MHRATKFERNRQLARKLWNHVSPIALQALSELTTKHSLSVAAGDLLLLEERWYVTHTGYWVWPTGSDALGSRYSLYQSFAISPLRDGRSVRRFTRLELAAALSVMGMPTLPTFRPSCMASKCVWLRPAPLTEHYAKLTASASARSRKSVPVQDQNNLITNQTGFPRNLPTGTTAVQRSAIVCARSSASTSSIPTW